MKPVILPLLHHDLAVALGPIDHEALPRFFLGVARVAGSRDPEVEEMERIEREIVDAPVLAFPSYWLLRSFPAGEAAGQVALLMRSPVMESSVIATSPAA